MRTVFKITSFSLVLLSLLCIPARAQERHMRLLAPKVGWALEADRLYWTKDNGTHWVDITPSAVSTPKGEPRSSVNIVSICFLHTSYGWLLLSQWDQSSRDWLFKIARTSDSGATWSVTPLSYADLPRYLRDALAGPAGMCFMDPLHGWIDMVFAGNSKPGKLLATQDGGRTWTWLDPDVVAGAIHFVTAMDGWLAGGPVAELYVTHDGGKSWQEVAFAHPPQVGAATGGTYHLPVFIDDRHGFAAVNYSGAYGTPPKFALFATEDGGKTWKPRRVLAEVGEPSIGSKIPFSIADSVLFLTTVAAAPTSTLIRIPLAGEFKSDVVVSSAGTLEISFVDKIHGWLLRANGDLLSTSNGGVTWAETAPWSRPNLRK